MGFDDTLLKISQVFLYNCNCYNSITRVFSSTTYIEYINYVYKMKNNYVFDKCV